MKLILCLTLLAQVAGHAWLAQLEARLRHSHNVQTASNSGSLVRALEFRHKLRVCNAYPFGDALDIFRGKEERLTGEQPMAYKSCRDFEAPLKTGDKLEFHIADATAGTFSVGDLPNNDAVLLLVIHRHDALSTAVAFESHVFSNLDNAQVAIIDTYKGSAQASPKIMDEPQAGNTTHLARTEELRYNSVVAVNPGQYEVVLSGVDGEMKAKTKLVALDHESYVVLRTGVEAKRGGAYPQELVVFPQSDAHLLKSGANMAAPLLRILAIFLAPSILFALRESELDAGQLLSQRSSSAAQLDAVQVLDSQLPKEVHDQLDEERKGWCRTLHANVAVSMAQHTDSTVRCGAN